VKKVLVIRFSSFGDVVQASTVNHQLKDAYPKVTIIWLTKRSFAQFLEKDPNVDQVVHLEDFGGLLSLARWLKLESFNLIYDAHRSMRSSMLFLISKLLRNHSTWVRRSKDRWKRFFLFKFRINLFPKPFVGQASYISPLTPYGLSLIPNKSNSEAASKTERGTAAIDLLSNGFKIRSDGSLLNGTGTLLYIAFAGAPLVNSKGVPANAR